MAGVSRSFLCRGVEPPPTSERQSALPKVELEEEEPKGVTAEEVVENKEETRPSGPVSRRLFLFTDK